MSEPVDRLIEELAELTAAAHLKRRPEKRRGRSTLASLIAVALAVLVLASVGVVLIKSPSPPTPEPISQASSAPSSDSPSTAPPTPSATTSATDTPTLSAPPTSVTPSAKPALEVQGYPRWAPDGTHLLVDSRGGNATHLIVSGDGAVVGSVPGTYVEADWVDSATVVAFAELTDDPNAHDVVLFDLAGHQIGAIGSYESALTSPGHRVMALTELARHGLSQGSRYQIWNDGTLSDWRDGHPIAFTPDGTRLVVLHPTGIPALDLGGTLSVVDLNGHQTFDLGNDWTSTTTDTQSFSPDGRYFATCLGDKQGGGESIRVVDTQTGSVDLIAERCASLLQWTSEPRLYAADVSNGVVTWTPNDGVVTADIPPETAIDVGVDGTLLNWVDAQPTLQVQSAAGTENFALPGGIEGVNWSPEAQLIAVVWGDQDTTGFFRSYLSIISPTSTEPLASPLPTPVPTPTPTPTAPPGHVTATDGTQWSVVNFDRLVTFGPSYVWSIDGSFVAVGQNCDDSKETCLMTSSDGLSWSIGGDIGTGPGTVVKVIHALGMYIAAGGFEGYHGGGLWTSPDGSSWQWQGGQDTFEPPGCQADRAVAHLYELFATDTVVVAEGEFQCGQATAGRGTWESMDGTTWTPVDKPHMFDVSKSHGVYVGADLNTDVSWSPDGLNWRRSGDINNFAVTAIATGFVGVDYPSPGMDPHRVITSTDGQNWTDIPNWLGTAWTQDLTSDGSRAVMTEPPSNGLDAGAVWASSSDGTKWVRYELPAEPGANGASVAIVGDRVVVVGDNRDGTSALWVTDVP